MDLDDVVFPVAVVAILVVVGCLVSWLMVLNQRTACERQWGASGYEWRYQYPTCLVRVDGRWMPSSSVRLEVAR